MRFYDPEKQILAMLFSQLASDAAKTGSSPAEIFSHALLRTAKRHQGDELRLPAFLCDASRTAEERYGWLCTQMDLFRETESMRRAEWRMATEQTENCALDCLIDDPDLPQTCQLLFERADTLLLAWRADESVVEGLRLHGAAMQCGLGVPVLVSSMELSVSLDGGLTLLAMSSVGEVQVNFARAERVTLFYDYSRPSDPVSVLLLPSVRLAYGLYKLLQKALRSEKADLSEAEIQLLPLSLAATLFCGRSDSIELAEEFAHDCGCPQLSECENVFSAAVQALHACASACQDEYALRLLAPMQGCDSASECMGAIRRFEAYCAYAKGERLVRYAMARLAEAGSAYAPCPLSGEQMPCYSSATEAVDRVMTARGYAGAWPHYRKEHTISGVHLFCEEGLYPHVTVGKKRVLSLVDCTTFMQGDSLCVRFASGTILLKKNEGASAYPDSDSAAFSQRGKRRIGQFAAGLILSEESRAEQLDLAQTAECAAKSAELAAMEKEERLRVVHASRRPLWFVALWWLWRGLFWGTITGVLALLVRGVAALFAVSMLTGLAPLWIGSVCGGSIFFVMLLLTVLGRRKL